jgi:hypothetical protein
MTLKDAVKLLKGPLKNLVKDESVTDVPSLRSHVNNELIAAMCGENPPTDKQIFNLPEFLRKTA